MNVRELLTVLYKVKNKTLPVIDDNENIIEHITEYENGVLATSTIPENNKYVILNEINLDIVTDDDGFKKIFDTEQEAIDYAEDNNIDAWHVIEIAWHTKT